MNKVNLVPRATHRHVKALNLRFLCLCCQSSSSGRGCDHCQDNYVPFVPLKLVRIPTEDASFLHLLSANEAQEPLLDVGGLVAR